MAKDKAKSTRAKKTATKGKAKLDSDQLKQVSGGWDPGNPKRVKPTR